MSYAQAAILGVVQGLTEFLPVSSSGHLVLVQAMFGWGEPNLLFEVSVHLATLLAVVIYYRNDIWHICRGAVGAKASTWQSVTARSWIGLILLASIPAAIAGLGLGDVFEATFADAYGTGVRLLATGALLFSTAPLITHRRSIGVLQAVAIGMAQALAILPGVSRSGATIATALHLGMEREQAARFSFLLSIPAVAGAFLLKAVEAFGTTGSGAEHSIGALAAGFVAALLSGYMAVALLIRSLARGRFALYGIWCWIAGLLAIWWFA